MYYPTWYDWSTYFGTIGLFVFLLLLFVRVLPVISIFEMRTLLPDAKPPEPTPEPTPMSPTPSTEGHA